MWNITTCFVCLSTQCKLYKIDGGKLKNEFQLVSGLKESDLTGMPSYLCVECSAQVKRFKNFREKCKRAHFTLQQMLKSKKQPTLLTLEALNRDRLKIAPSLSYLNLDRVHYETVTFKLERFNRLGVSTQDSIPIFQCSTTETDDDVIPSKRCRLTLNNIKQEIEDANQTIVTNNESENLNDIPFDGDDDFNNDGVDEMDFFVKNEVEEDSKNVDGANLEEEYASMVPISIQEARAATEVYKMFGNGKFPCEVCGKKFHNDSRLQIHMRMHDQHISGNYKCDLCQAFYKTDFLHKTHMTEKHLYKYICKKCPEVSFDRLSAKQHYILTHLQKGSKKSANWYETRPSWLSKKGGKRSKGVLTLRPVRKIVKMPEDFPVYSPVSQEEQYQLVLNRKNSRNYLEATYKCEMCFKGFREPNTYEKHMKKHNPEISGTHQCDMCKVYFRDARRIYKHMIISHLFKYSCQLCSYVCFSRGQAHMHYRWHKNVTYDCPHCDKEFKKASTRLTHIRIKHPSTFICNLCGHSFVSENGLYCHKRIAHTTEEVEAANQIETEPDHPNYCEECEVQFVTVAAYTTHLGSSSKHSQTNLSTKPSMKAGSRARPRRSAGRPRNGSSDIVNTGVPTASHCELCGKLLSNDVAAKKHYECEHPGADYLKRYMCDVCGHTTRQYANLMVHMRTHTREKPYGCPHCGRSFSMPSNRDRHLVVHTGEKKYQCHHCSRRFTQSSAVKLHIQTVHLKIPYAPWDKKNRKRRKEMEALSSTGVGVGVGPALAAPPLPQHKIVLDTHAQYLNAYITYNDE